MTEKLKPRQMFAFDLTAEWKSAVADNVLPNYPTIKTQAELIRRIYEELVACFTSEEEMRERRLLAEYESIGRPEIMMFAVKNADRLRREESNPAHVSEVSRRKAHSGGKRGR